LTCWAIALLLHLLLFGGSSAAGEKEHLAMALALVEKMNASKMFVDLAESFMETYFERFDTPAATDRTGGNPLRILFRDEVRIGENELKWMLAEIYAAHFTETELQQIIRFYSTSAGRAWLDKRLTIATEMEQVGLEWGRLLTQRVIKKFETQYGDKLDQ
jgi:hypothetical protein